MALERLSGSLALKNRNWAVARGGSGVRENLKVGLKGA